MTHQETLQETRGANFRLRAFLLAVLLGFLILWTAGFLFAESPSTEIDFVPKPYTQNPGGR